MLRNHKQWKSFSMLNEIRIQGVVGVVFENNTKFRDEDKEDIFRLKVNV